MTNTQRRVILTLCFWLNAACALASSMASIRAPRFSPLAISLAEASLVHLGMLVFCWLMLTYVVKRETP